MVVDYYVPKSIAKRAAQISQSYEQYKYLTFLKTPVKNSYILTLLLITLVIIFAATWCGIYLSKGITVPIQQLAEGTHEVAQGNWDYKIESSGDDEIGVLMNSFNQMTGDLKQIKLELERRGTVVETLLANIAAGVVSVDPAGNITTWNKAAEKILGVKAEPALGEELSGGFCSRNRSRGCARSSTASRSGEKRRARDQDPAERPAIDGGGQRGDPARRRRLDVGRHGVSRRHYPNPKSAAHGSMARSRAAHRP